MFFSSHRWLMQLSIIRITRIFALAAIGIFAISVLASPALAVPVPFQAQKVGAICTGTPKFECFCTFKAPLRTTIEHASVGADLPIGTRVLQVYLEYLQDDDDAARAFHYLPAVREIQVPNGQYFSASGPMLARSMNSTIYLTFRYDFTKPVASKIRCMIQGHSGT